MLNIGLRPSSPKFLPPFGIAVIAKDLQPRTEASEFHFPIDKAGRRHYDQMWTPYPLVGREVGQHGYRLQSLPESPV